MPDGKANLQVLRALVEQQYGENLVVDHSPDDRSYPEQKRIEIKRSIDRIRDLQKKGLDIDRGSEFSRLLRHNKNHTVIGKWEMCGWLIDEDKRLVSIFFPSAQNERGNVGSRRIS
jgi:hypothetical protein